MRKRVQVLFEESEVSEIRRAARGRRMTVAEWVRQAVRAAQSAEAPADPARKLAAIRAGAAHDFPVGDVDDMLGEIERGYMAERR